MFNIICSQNFVIFLLFSYFKLFKLVKSSILTSKIFEEKVFNLFHCQKVRQFPSHDTRSTLFSSSTPLNIAKEKSFELQLPFVSRYEIPQDKSESVAM
jgi:hypothetical protein